jgi:magnesium-transporting ATPase (P-type)
MNGLNRYDDGNRTIKSRDKAVGAGLERKRKKHGAIVFGGRKLEKTIIKICLYLASVCLGMSVAALIMAEFNLSSIFGGWHPTYETAIAYGVISIAFSNLLKT